MEKPVLFRRCHLCGHLNQLAVDPTGKCTECGKAFAPFFYFDDRFTAVMSDTSIRDPRNPGEYSPIQGLTAYWESF